MGDFEFGIDLLISVVEGRPVLWDKTDGVCKKRNETTRKKHGEKFVLFSRRLRSSMRCSKKQLLLSSAIIY